ncbi:MAG: adenylyltransferase/cytidyltransferase family protein [Bacteroidales bacterium]|nr:adenylyltransferase/cytidyltransferase family protein [Bacteroidales bacterium]
MNKRVFVSGCYDMLHSGHVAFFKEASQFGDLYVGIGSDRTILELKNRRTINSERERLYMVKSIRYVRDACINTGSGIMDFIESVDRFKPDIFVVNADGSTPEKEQFCKERGIEYIVLERTPEDGLEARSTTSLRNTVKSQIPYRIDLAGTWIDQPYVSKYHGGWAITVSIEPTQEFEERSGMSTSTRKAIKKLFPYQLPDYNPELLAKLVFCFENEPTLQQYVSGAQDSIGICIPGLVRHYYNGNYWPDKIEQCDDESILSWLEEHICLVHTFNRPADTHVDADTNISEEGVKALADAAEGAWNAIMNKDLTEFAKYFNASFDAQIKMFPHMVSEELQKYINLYKEKSLALKLSGAGGGGYLILLVDKPLENSIRIKIRRKDNL